MNSSSSGTEKRIAPAFRTRGGDGNASIARYGLARPLHIPARTSWRHAASIEFGLGFAKDVVIRGILAQPMWFGQANIRFLLKNSPTRQDATRPPCEAPRVNCRCMKATPFK